MSYSFSIIGKEPLNLIQLITKNTKIEFTSINDLIKTDKKKLILCTKNVELDELKKTLDLFKPEASECIIMLPKIFQNVNFSKNFILKFFPMKIKDFEMLLDEDKEENKIFFNDIIIKPNNFVYNSTNINKIYFTETEISIFKHLVENKLVKKDSLKTKILNFQISMETKSLESHLSRIRKKLQLINSKIQIVSVENKSIKVC